MSSKKPQSGAQKRKIRKDKWETAAKISKPLTHFSFTAVYNKENANMPITVTEPLELTQLSKTDDVELHARSSTSTTTHSEELESNQVSDGGDGAGPRDEVAIDEPLFDSAETDNAVDQHNQDMTERCSDRGTYSMEITQPSLDIRDFILQCSPCQPDTHFPENSHGRRFSSMYYTLKTKTGLYIRRKWLCYSLKLDKAYCETCWLFANRSSPHFRSEWVTGVGDWQHLSQSIARHETSLFHIKAMRDRSNYEENRTINSAINEGLLREADKWKQVLRRIFKIIISLTTSNNPLRGHTEKFDDPNPGNFLREVKLLAEFDPVLKELIYDQNKKVKYLGHDIQNEIVQIISSALKLQICDEIREGRYFSIIMDSTTDITKKEQVSLVLRYCRFDETSSSLVTNESFIGFFDLDNRSAKGYEDLLMGILKTLQLDFSFCRGQGYDGASVMSGEHNGLQANLKKINQQALYVHCSAYKLNLVLTDGVKFNSSMAEFFNDIQAVYKFFHASGIRWKELELASEDGAQSKNQNNSITLKAVCETRWEARHASVLAIKARYIDILKALTKIILLSKKKEEVAEATGVRKRLESFQFIIILVVWEKILRSFNVLSKKLQSVEVSLEECVVMWQNGIESLKNLKRDISDVKAEAQEIACKWGVSPTFSAFRKVKKTRFFDGIGIDTARKTALSENSLFEEILTPVIDNIIFQMSTRFESTYTVFDLFSFLTPSNILDLPESDLLERVNRFCVRYGNDVSSNLYGELVNLKVSMRSEICEIQTIRDIINLLFHFNLRESFPNVVISCILYLTLPVSVASAERSFSKLKLIKNYLRSRMSQERLSGMALLSVEGKRAQTLDIDKLIEVFAKNKARRKQI